MPIGFIGATLVYFDLRIKEGLYAGNDGSEVGTWQCFVETLQGAQWEQSSPGERSATLVLPLRVVPAIGVQGALESALKPLPVLGLDK